MSTASVGDEPHRRAVVARLLGAAAACAVWVVLVYGWFVRTRVGQELDDAAYEGRHAVLPRATEATDELLGAITTTSLAVLGTALVVVALLRRRWRLALAVAVALGGAILTSEVLKRVLDRPEHPGVEGLSGNSYPSGHATIAMALALGLVTVAPRRWRAGVGTLAALFATAVGIGVLASGWHRPSDSLGAYGVALGWYTAVAALLVAWRGTGADDAHDVDGRDDPEPAAVAVGALAVLAVVVVGIVLTVDRADELVAVRFRVDYVLACTVVAVVGVGMLVAFALLLGPTTLDPPHRTYPATRHPNRHSSREASRHSPGLRDQGP